jgi:hypothetical protein
MVAPVLSFTGSPTWNAAAAAGALVEPEAVEPAVALVSDPAPVGAAVVAPVEPEAGDAVEGIDERGVVDWLVEPVVGEAPVVVDAPPVVPAPAAPWLAATADPARARARPAARRGGSERMKVSLGHAPQQRQTALGQDRSSAGGAINDKVSGR